MKIKSKSDLLNLVGLSLLPIRAWHVFKGATKEYIPLKIFMINYTLLGENEYLVEKLFKVNKIDASKLDDAEYIKKTVQLLTDWSSIIENTQVEHIYKNINIPTLKDLQLMNSDKSFTAKDLKDLSEVLKYVGQA
jgi:hypothetical protein